MDHADTDMAWAVRVPMTELARIGRLRLMPTIEICEDAGNVWLRGSTVGSPQDAVLRTLAQGVWFVVLPDGRLRARESRIPTGRLPNGPWVSIADWIVPDLPAAAMAGKFEQRVPLMLVRSAHELEPGVLVTTPELWSAYAAEAPQVRRECWFFAMSADGRVIIRGEPLPSLPGERFSLEQGIAMPIGWTTSPLADPAVLRELLGLDQNSVALFHRDGTWELVPEDGFVRATHAAVRLSIREAAHAG